MSENKKLNYLIISIILSLISISISISINIKIANAYLKADGKTKALFGIIEVLGYGYQYYVAIPVVTSLILFVIGLSAKNVLAYKLVAMFLFLIATVILVSRIWRLFI